MNSRDFWVNYADIAKFKTKYPGLTYEMLHNQDEMHPYETFPKLKPSPNQLRR